jgi:hypothetical protein
MASADTVWTTASIKHNDTRIFRMRFSLGQPAGRIGNPAGVNTFDAGFGGSASFENSKQHLVHRSVDGSRRVKIIRNFTN